jgi:uncharacterized membrane protein YkgB
MMNSLIARIAKMRIFCGDFDNHLVRASMVLIYFMFGYQKWFQYEAQGLVPFFTHGPLIFWMYPVFGIRGSAYFLGVSDRCLHFSAPSRSFRSGLRAGPHRRADFLQ